MFEILSVVGARPQIIKAAAISRAIGRHPDILHETILHTGQHYDEMMSSVFFDELDVPRPQINLGVGSGSHGGQTAGMLKGIEEAILGLRPDLLLIYGDTNSTLAAALAASKVHVPVAHVEAGLRSFNKAMPEELNRIVADHCSTLLFCPTQTGVDNLRAEGFRLDDDGRPGIDSPRVLLSGDVMFDNTLYFAEKSAASSRVLIDLGLKEGSFHLATVHRDNNTDNLGHMLGILRALGEISMLSQKPVVLPLHPRTRKALGDERIDMLKGEFPGLKLTEPLSFLDISLLEKSCDMVFTDSGGVQKEAFFHRKPVIVLREETEWVEIVECGAGILTGSSPDRIIAAYQRFAAQRPEHFPAIFGDGQAAMLIAGTIVDFLTGSLR